jgi:hypothetical protein
MSLSSDVVEVTAARRIRRVLALRRSPRCELIEREE